MAPLTTMIDLNRIRSLKTLESMRKILADFIAFDPVMMKDVYMTDYGWGEEDYEADKDNASYLLEQVERRMKSLGRHLARASKAGSESAC
jgi:hypothetical protein